MAILTTAGRAAFLEAIRQQDIHLAWGAGDVSWGSSPPAPSVSASALVSEIGRREVLAATFVVPDAEGDIEVPDGTFSTSPTPSRYLLLDFHFDFTDAESATVREVGVFVGTIRNVGVSPSKAYLLPGEIDEPGTLLLLENFGPGIVRSPGIRERFRYVVTL
jgi:hypothetical protein